MLTLKDIILVADTPNKNKHIYSKKLLEQQVERLKDAIKNRGLIGQIDFPLDFIIHFDSASHLVTDLRMEGDNMVADIETLDTFHGRMLETMIVAQQNGGRKLALRPYGVGGRQVDSDGNLVIGDSYKMISISVVDADKAA